MPINYALAQAESPKLKATLTRAINKGRYSAVLAACIDAVHAWEAWGAWPDNWSRWQRALDDAATKHNHTEPREYIQSVRLEEL
jgi:hypothetical protein